jgi:hypothetical protein
VWKSTMRDNEVGAMQEPKGHGQRKRWDSWSIIHLLSYMKLLMPWTLLCFALFCFVLFCFVFFLGLKWTCKHLACPGIIASNFGFHALELDRSPKPMWDRYI